MRTRSVVAILASGLVVLVVALNAGAQGDKPKPVEISEEWMEDNTQPPFKELMKGSRLTKVQFNAEAAKLEKEADKLVGVCKVIAVSKPPKMDNEKRTQKAWTELANMTEKCAADVGKAAKAKNATMYLDAFKKLDDACNRCHGIFKD